MEAIWVVVNKAGDILYEGTKNECAVYFMKHCGKIEITGGSNIMYGPKDKYIEAMRAMGREC